MFSLKTGVFLSHGNRSKDYHNTLLYKYKIKKNAHNKKLLDVEKKKLFDDPEGYIMKLRSN
jgi:hypothetical protein